jgi:hypothetical protein
MSNDAFILRHPRSLTKLEVIEIHLLVKATHPTLGLPPKSEPCKPAKEKTQ